MGRYAARYGVNVHGWGLMHNHGYWIFEASSEDSISNLMRDMQSCCYSRYLNTVPPLTAHPDQGLTKGVRVPTLSFDAPASVICGCKINDYSCPGRR